MNFLGKTLHIVDGPTFYCGYNEIFEKRIYEFKTEKKEPVIIDCGANIGLSVLFFKTLYPTSKIKAYEADSTIFQTLKQNVETFNLVDVQLFNKAVWIEDGIVDFSKEGAYSGRISKGDEKGPKIRTQTVDLSLILKEEREIEFLKLDIEGAEYAVLLKCGALLNNVKHLFIEYHSHFSEEQKLDEILALLRKKGFRYQIQEAYVNNKPFVEKELMLGMDLQLNIFAYK